MLDEKTCWQAVISKDAGSDGRFYYGVKSTGIYCRPSCPSRRPLRQNVRFYQSRSEAEQDGLRPCMRCRPDTITFADSNKLRVRRISEYIRENCENGRSSSLSELGREVGWSVFHLQRTFKKLTGITPKEFEKNCRTEVLKSRLRRGPSVTDAIFDAGFGSSSRVYEEADASLGMTPAEYRSGGQGVTISHVSVMTPLGLMALGATDRGLCFLQFGESEQELLHKLHAEYPNASLEKMKEPYPPIFQNSIQSLLRYLRKEQIRLDVPLDVNATAFQLKVWKYLQSIPYGEVQSYGEIAAALGNPKATRAVARACAANKVAIVIPCHRVIRGTGELGGYKWGLDRKRVLLDTERSGMAVRTASR
jgi:AraC family transcriptional regulator of adaptative response/methylated-DNA-[protein]-cysteine methyltransferase